MEEFIVNLSWHLGYIILKINLIRITFCYTQLNMCDILILLLCFNMFVKYFRDLENQAKDLVLRLKTLKVGSLIVYY